MNTERNPSQTSSSACPGQQSVRLSPPNLSNPLPPVTAASAFPPTPPLSQGRRRPRRRRPGSTPQVEFQFSESSRCCRAPQTCRLPIGQDVFADVPKRYPLPLWRSRLRGFGGGLLQTASVLLMTITFGLGWAAFEIEFVRASQHLLASSPNRVDEAATPRISRGKNGPFLTFDDATSVGGRGSRYDPGTTDDGAPSPWTRAEPSSGTAQSNESNSAQAPPSSKP
jgi:hypothetical protein